MNRRRFRTIKVKVPTGCKETFKDLNPDLISNDVEYNDSPIKYNIFEIDTTQVKHNIWNITCENLYGSSVSHFIVKAVDINNAIAFVENKIDTDIWSILSVTQIKPISSDLIYTDYPII